MSGSSSLATVRILIKSPTFGIPVLEITSLVATQIGKFTVLFLVAKTSLVVANDSKSGRASCLLAGRILL